MDYYQGRSNHKQTGTNKQTRRSTMRRTEQADGKSNNTNSKLPSKTSKGLCRKRTNSVSFASNPDITEVDLIVYPDLSFSSVSISTTASPPTTISAQLEHEIPPPRGRRSTLSDVGKDRSCFPRFWLRVRRVVFGR